MTVRRINNPTHRALLAIVLTAIIVAPFEAVSFYNGDYLGWYIGVFGAPLAIALVFYGSVKERLLAWVLLTLLSLLVVVVVIVGLWYA